ncbi:Cna B-type domain-containing protein [Enterococcus sp. LJL99]
MRPNKILVDLYQNGNFLMKQEVTVDNDWRYSFEDLPKLDSNGKEYVHTVKEEPVNGYDTTINGTTITNK